MIALEDRQALVQDIGAAQIGGARLSKACEVCGIDRRTLHRWKADATAPDATTVLKFRRLLEESNFTERIFSAINSVRAVKGFPLKEGTVVDVTVIEAPSSTKNKNGTRDSEMHQTKKGNQ